MCAALFRRLPGCVCAPLFGIIHIDDPLLRMPDLEVLSSCLCYGLNSIHSKRFGFPRHDKIRYTSTKDIKRIVMRCR